METPSLDLFYTNGLPRHHDKNAVLVFLFQNDIKDAKKLKHHVFQKLKNDIVRYKNIIPATKPICDINFYYRNSAVGFSLFMNIEEIILVDDYVKKNPNKNHKKEESFDDLVKF